MNITQIVDIPADHKLTIDVPPDVPEGRVTITYTPPRKRGVPKLGCLKGQIWMADDFDAPLALVKAELVNESICY